MVSLFQQGVWGREGQEAGAAAGACSATSAVFLLNDVGWMWVSGVSQSLGADGRPGPSKFRAGGPRAVLYCRGQRTHLAL